MAGDRDALTRRSLAALGIPAFGIALAYTVVTTYLPVIIARLSGPAITGIIVGGEGVLALILPVLIGNWSDSTQSRLGARLPFILVGAVVCVVGLALIPVLSDSVLGIGFSLAVFFVGYFVYLSPYYALFPDVVPEFQHGRSQGAQGLFRSAGMLMSLALGGILLSWWRPLPFMVGGLMIIAVTVVLYVTVRPRVRPVSSVQKRQSGWVREWHLLRTHPDIRRWAIANALWETAIGVLRVFVVLYFIKGLGLTLVQVSGALALVGLAAVVAAPLSGRLADRHGSRPVMLISLWIFAVGLLPPVFTTNIYFIAGIVPVAFAAVVMITLPYSMLMGLLDQERQHGIGAGLFGFSRGIGVLLGPLLGGLAVLLAQSLEFLVFDETMGYSAVFLVTSVVLFASIPVLRRIGRG